MSHLKSSFTKKVERPMSDNDDLRDMLNPRNPHSPYHRSQWDSPYSVVNPSSPYYDPVEAQSYAESRAETFWLIVFVIGIVILGIGLFLLVLFGEKIGIPAIGNMGTSIIVLFALVLWLVSKLPK